MPPKQSQTRKRATRNTDEGPLAQRSRRQSTRNATLGSQATTQVRTEDETSAVPPSNVPSTTIQRLDPDLMKSLVSTVAEEVTRQITGLNGKHGAGVPESEFRSRSLGVGAPECDVKKWKTRSTKYGKHGV